MEQQHLPQETSNRGIQAIVKRLASAKAQEREQAEQEFRSVIERYAQAIARNHKLQVRLWAAYFSCLTAMVMLLLLLADVPTSVARLIEVFGSLLSIGSFVSIRRLARKQENLGSQLTEMGSQLTKLDDVHIIGPLLDVLVGKTGSSWSKAPYPDIKNALIRLLPRLKSSDTTLLTPQQRKKLWVLLKMGASPWLDEHTVGAALMVEILRALEQVGDEQAIPTVEHLAKSAKHRAVRKAAQECLPFLSQRSAEYRAEHTLLRAANASDTPSRVLLRPASTTETEREQLLRASTAEENSKP
jgi:hypothetical protein